MKFEASLEYLLDTSTTSASGHSSPCKDYESVLTGNMKLVYVFTSWYYIIWCSSIIIYVGIKLFSLSLHRVVTGKIERMRIWAVTCHQFSYCPGNFERGEDLIGRGTVVWTPDETPYSSLTSYDFIRGYIGFTRLWFSSHSAVTPVGRFRIFFTFSVIC